VGLKKPIEVTEKGILTQGERRIKSSTCKLKGKHQTARWDSKNKLKGPLAAELGSTAVRGSQGTDLAKRRRKGFPKS